MAETTGVMIPKTVGIWLQGIEEERGTEAADNAARQFIDTADHYKKELLKTEVLASRVLIAHQAADKLMEMHLDASKLKKDVTCRRGCHECCRMYVALTPSEARLILKTIKARNMEVDWEKLSRQAGKVEDDFYNHIMGEDNKCVFVDEKGSCKIYKMRPLSCRNHLVASPKELCSMETNNKVKKVFSPEIEAMTFAYISLEGLENLSMSDGLLRYKKEEGL